MYFSLVVLVGITEAIIQILQTIFLIPSCFLYFSEN